MNLFRIEPIEGDSVRLYLADKPFESIVITPPTAVDQDNLIKVMNLTLTASETLRQREDHGAEPKTVKYTENQSLSDKGQDQAVSERYTNPRNDV